MRVMSVAGALALRLIILVRRSPAVFIPSLVIPLFILISTSGGFHGVENLPVFGGVSYLAFTVPMAATLGAGFAGTTAGISIARDLEGGFFARLQVSPAPRVSLAIAPVISSMLRSLITTTIVFAAGLIGGIDFPSAGGLLVLYLFPLLFAGCSAFWAEGIALRAKTIQSAPLMQIAVFLAVFLSVAYVPREAQSGWLATVSDYNPMTFVLEAARDGFLGGVAWHELWPGLVAAAGMLVVLGAWAITGLRKLDTD